MTKHERKALQKLNETDDTVTTKSEESGAVIIVDVKGYIRETESQLKNMDNYDRLNMIKERNTTY